MISWIGTIRSLGFGAMFGAGLALFITATISMFAPPERVIPHQQLTVAGALVGGGLHQLIDRWLIGAILSPLSKFACFYFRLAQLRLFLRMRRLSGNTAPPTITQVE